MDFLSPVGVLQLRTSVNPGRTGVYLPLSLSGTAAFLQNTTAMPSGISPSTVDLKDQNHTTFSYIICYKSVSH